MAIDLQNELTELRRAILNMSACVEQRVALAFDALLENDVDAARTVREGDDEIDEMDLDIEAECLRILALSHPVAGDLRFVLSALRINGDLERAGDCARSISKRVLALNRETLILDLPPTIPEMVSRARQMFSDAIVALADANVDLAKRVVVADDRVDDLQKEVFVWVQDELPRNTNMTNSFLNVLSIARKLERIADIATNIAEDVVFLVEGAIVRHQNSLES